MFSPARRPAKNRKDVIVPCRRTSCAVTREYFQRIRIAYFDRRSTGRKNHPTHAHLLALQGFQIDPRGGKYYWIGGDDLGFANEDGTDCKTVQDGYVSVTPLQVDLTDYKLLNNSTLPTFPWP